MKKLFLGTVLLFFTVILTQAQKAPTQLGVAAELGFPTGDFGDGFKTGFGGSLKGLFGVSKDGQLSFTTGYTRYAYKDNEPDYKGSISIVPFLAGYRQNFNGFYLEPQLGYGSYTARVKSGGIKVSNTKGGFTYAAGLGYASKGFDIGARYQGAKVDGDNISLIGIHVGYNFSLSINKSKK